MAAWDENCTYHGVMESTSEADDRVEVELSEYGPTERENVVVLRTLRPAGDWRSYGVGWGYNGGGTSAAASTILSDALGEEPSDQLREDFCVDVLSQLTDEWRLRRGAVLRWVRGVREPLGDLALLPFGTGCPEPGKDSGSIPVSPRKCSSTDNS